jgi:hypothetical protein
MPKETKKPVIIDETEYNISTSGKNKLIKFEFNPIKVNVKKYNLKFPIDGMF